MIQINGSFGEGGGQILRSSLALSCVTGQPFQIHKVRAGRKKPGLMRQHLTAVQAAAKICSAEVHGDEIGSTELSFTPGKIRGGEYQFSIGTAGSTTLVFQTVILPLSLCDQPSRIILEGGTHNPFAPPFDFLAKAYIPILNRMGPNITARLERPGFYPAGGGRIVVDVDPVSQLTGIELFERGEFVRRCARAYIANLPQHVADRELKTLREKLCWADDEFELCEVTKSSGPGNIVIIELEYENVTEVLTAFGHVGRSAEAVANHAVQQCQRFLKSSTPVGEYLTDQLMLPMALAGSGGFLSIGLSRHADTHLQLISEFIDVDVHKKDNNGGGTMIRFRSNGQSC